MRHGLAIFMLLSIMLSFDAAYPETYVWTDDTGTAHFSDDMGKVPKKYRKKLRTDDDVPVARPPAPAVSSAEVKASPEPKSSAAVPAKDDKKAAPTASGEKTFEYWQKALADKEAAMGSVRSSIEAIVTRLKNVSMTAEQREKLVTEHNALVGQFNQLKSQYGELVDGARKSGFQVNLQQ